MNTILNPQWAKITLDAANTSIRNGWHPAAALRATSQTARMTSDDTAVLAAWCPEKRGYVTQKVQLESKQWKIA